MTTLQALALCLVSLTACGAPTPDRQPPTASASLPVLGGLAPVATAQPAATTAAVAVVAQPAPEPGAEEFACPALIGGAELTARWPELLGQRVRMVGRVDRALGMVNSIVIADRRRFVVLLRPGAGWAGEAERTYDVMGAATVATGGATRLPQLLLVEDAPPCTAP